MESLILSQTIVVRDSGFSLSQWRGLIFDCVRRGGRGSVLKSCEFSPRSGLPGRINGVSFGREALPGNARGGGDGEGVNLLDGSDGNGGGDGGGVEGGVGGGVGFLLPWSESCGGDGGGVSFRSSSGIDGGDGGGVEFVLGRVGTGGGGGGGGNLLQGRVGNGGGGGGGGTDGAGGDDG